MPLTSYYENIVERRYDNQASITDERLAPIFEHVATPEPPKTGAPFRLTYIDQKILKKAESEPEGLSPPMLRWIKRKWTPAHYKALGERSLDALASLAATLARGEHTALAQY
jgi:hypothetical protein